MSNGDATKFGLRSGDITWSPEFTASRDNKGLWTGSESFTCNLSEITALVPDNGSACQFPGFQFMKSVGCSVKNNEGDTTVVTVNYSGTVTPDFEFGEDNPELASSSSMAISVSQQDIRSHPRYSDLTLRERAIVNQYDLDVIKVGRISDEGVIETMVPKIHDANIGSIAITGERLQELLGYITKGVRSYLVPSQIYRLSYSSKVAPTGAELNAVGYIDTPQGAPVVGGGRTWLSIGLSYTEEGGVYSITKEWELSGPGGHDPILYTDS